MEHTAEGTSAGTASVEHETQLVREAIAMVASGGSRRVVLAGIRHGEALLEPARRLALQSGVRILPLWRDDSPGVDLSVERVRE